MLFNSIQFLLFFPLAALIYFLIPQKIRWVWLLAASYYFYICWNAKYLILILISTLITYLGGILISAANHSDLNEQRKRRRKKLWVALSFILNLSILFFFKYFNFAIGNINSLLTALNMQLVQPQFDIILPVGISFYTFQALGYIVDVYRGEVEAEKNIGKYALFVSFFPQLLAGPIGRSNSLLTQINDKHRFDYDKMRDGLLMMTWGLFLKMLIADRAAIFVNQVYNNYAQYSGAILLVATLLFTIQIYCDFAGYSYIAVGAAKVMGFKLMDNFKQPYLATSIRDFWRRWHISLSTWFRDYLYIPLGGNRKGKMRKYINTMITFVLSGLWHGANWTYMVWGALHGAYQVTGEITTPIRDKVKKALRIKTESFSYKLGQGIITFLLVSFAWIFFRASNIKSAIDIIGRMITSFGPLPRPGEALYAIGLGVTELMVLAAAVFLLVVVDGLQGLKIDIGGFVKKQQFWFRWVIYTCLVLLIIVFGIYGNNYAQSQFIYFQF